jgi:hypothetical protein
MLRFPYLDEPLSGPAPPSLLAGTLVRWRPLVLVTIIGPAGATWDFGRAVLDPAADDTVVPLDTAQRIGTVLKQLLDQAGATYILRDRLVLIVPAK